MRGQNNELRLARGDSGAWAAMRIAAILGLPVCARIHCIRVLNYWVFIDDRSSSR